MTGDELRRLLVDALPRLAEAREELRDLDAALGDGDLGITVGDGSAAIAAALRGLAPDASPADVLRAAGATFARANPSTFSALAAGALLAGARELGDVPDVGPQDALRAMRVAIRTIETRGRSAVGDKTMLDALVPSVDAAEADPDHPLAAAVKAARDGVESTRDLVSKRGRAAWIGDRTAGHADPGAVAYVRLLEALIGASPVLPD
jgi:phosphoenolpyruvate---glycerone phosphotransferase subunit DhaL